MNINGDWKFMVVVTLGVIALAAGVEFEKSQQQYEKDIKQLKEEMERRFQQIDSNLGDLKEEIQKVKSDTDRNINTLSEQYTNLSKREKAKRAPSTSKSTFTEISLDGVADFFKRLLELDSKGNIKDIMRLYADEVDYITEGFVGHSTIIQDKQNYFKRWPKRLYAYKSVIARPFHNSNIKVIFTYYFLLDDNIDCFSGEVERVFLLTRKYNKLFIIRENKGRFLTKNSGESGNCQWEH